MNPENKLIKSIELINPENIAKNIGYKFLNERIIEAKKNLKINLNNNSLFNELQGLIDEAWLSNQLFNNIKLNNHNELINEFQAADAILKNYKKNIEMDYRHFSIQIFKDSKKFTNIRKNIANLLKIHNPYLELLNAEEVLSFYGVISLTHPIYLSGNIKLNKGNEEINGSFPPFIGLVTDGITSMKNIGSPGIRLVTSIENLATFERYIKEEKKTDELVLFTHGVPTPPFIRLYKKIANSFKAAKFQHWGDIDEAGFKILNILENSIDKDVDSFRMTPKVFDASLSHVDFTELEIERLKNLNLSIKNLNALKECLIVKKKFEQEAYY